MASSLPSVEFVGSSTKIGSSVTWRCRSVNRTSSGFCSGNLSASAIPRSSASSQVNSAAMLVSCPFGDIIPVPHRNFDHHFAWFLDDQLASQARFELQVGSHVELVGFVVVHGAQQLFALLHHH